MIAKYLTCSNQYIYVNMQILRLRTRVSAALKQCRTALDYRGRDFSLITQRQESCAAHLFTYRNLTSLLRRIVYTACVRAWSIYALRRCAIRVCNAVVIVHCDCTVALSPTSFYRLVQRVNNDDDRVLCDLWRIK